MPTQADDKGILRTEHEYLGAIFDDESSTPFSYPGTAQLSHAGEGAFLVDLSGLAYALVTGAEAEQLCNSAFTAEPLKVGECGFEPALTGDGGLASISFVSRTGDNEYVLLDASARGELMLTWLGFLAKIEQDGYAPYANTTVEDAADTLVPLLLAGAQARTVLSDYVSSPSELPVAGCVASLRLDSIPAVVASMPGCPQGLDAYVVFVPEGSARILWRSFLSFQQVSPAGSQMLLALLESWFEWMPRIADSDLIRINADELRQWGLLRGGQDFVGARALLA